MQVGDTEACMRHAGSASAKLHLQVLAATRPQHTHKHAAAAPLTPQPHLQRQLSLPLRHVHVAPADQRRRAAGVGLAAVVGIARRRRQLPLQCMQRGQVDRRPRALPALAALKLPQQRHRRPILLARKVLVRARQLHLTCQHRVARRTQLLPAPVKAPRPPALVHQWRQQAGGGENVRICLCLPGTQLGLQGIRPCGGAATS